MDDDSIFIFLFLRLHLSGCIVLCMSMIPKFKFVFIRQVKCLVFMARRWSFPFVCVV